MKIKKNLLDKLNEQINKEFYSAYLYLAMAADFEAKNLPGFGQWLQKQAAEEVKHAMKIYGFLNERGEKVVLDVIKKPAGKWATPLVAFEAALKHEEYITDSINKLYELAMKEKDYPSQVMLQWFIDEQVEEEDSVGAVVEQLKMVGTAKHALLMMDVQMAKRE